ncbi:MAG: helix-turn-helix transcriptional regulator [Hellea sp.]|nr:helix-turn-helix transcriptional regulator [Hellea sp.]
MDLCPTRAVFSKLSGKWPVLIITHLSFGSHRFSELLGAIPDISQRMLTQTLRSLERDGMAIRTATASIPPRVDYRLSELGQSYLEGLESILQWSLKSRAEIEAAQAAYDDRAAAKIAKAS